jgi:hypothetical protein
MFRATETNSKSIWKTGKRSNVSLSDLDISQTYLEKLRHKSVKIVVERVSKNEIQKKNIPSMSFKIEEHKYVLKSSVTKDFNLNII